jgi:hypothetical protein
MRTELIEKLEKVILINAGDSRLHLGLMKQPPLVDCRVIAEDLYQEIIQALSEPKGVSAEEVKKIALEKYPIEMVSIFTKMDFVDKNAERRIIFIEAYYE